MTSRPALTFITRDTKPEPRAGAPIRTHRLLTGLAEAFAVTLVTFEHAERSTHGHVPAAALREAHPGVEVVTLPGVGAAKRRAQLLGVPRIRSHEWGRYRTGDLRRAVERVVAAGSPAVVHFDDPGVAQVGPVPGPLNAAAPHNVEHRILAGTATASSGVRAAYARLEAAKVRREEHALWRAMDLMVAVSDLDADAMRAGGASDVIVCPNGTDLVEPLPPVPRAASEPLRLLFVGTGTYWPNEHGITWLVREVLPLLRGRLDVVLEVVGSPPNRPAQAPGVTYAGRVADLRPHYDRAHVVVVPLHRGSGTRLKVLEAMAYGRPVVSTTLGAEGLPVRPGEEFVCADDATAFAAALQEVAARLDGAGGGVGDMLARARSAAEALAWPRVAARLGEDYLARVAARRSSSATGATAPRP